MTAISKPLVRCFANATSIGGAGSVSGRDAIAKMLRDNVIVYQDGTPRTKHLIINSEPASLFFARQAEGRRSPCGAAWTGVGSLKHRTEVDRYA